MNARIEVYREQNAQLIQKNSDLMVIGDLIRIQHSSVNSSYQAEEKYQLETILKEEAHEFHARKREDQRLQQQEIIDRDLKQRQIMNDLVWKTRNWICSCVKGSSEADVNTILSRHSRNNIPTAVDQQERGSSLLLKLSKLSRGSGTRADAHQQAIKDPLESPFAREEISLPSKYRDPYATTEWCFPFHAIGWWRHVTLSDIGPPVSRFRLLWKNRFLEC